MSSAQRKRPSAAGRHRGHISTANHFPGRFLEEVLNAGVFLSAEGPAPVPRSRPPRSPSSSTRSTNTSARSTRWSWRRPGRRSARVTLRTRSRPGFARRVSSQRWRKSVATSGTGVRPRRRLPAPRDRRTPVWRRAPGELAPRSVPTCE